jgi:hypothetical protein
LGMNQSSNDDDILEGIGGPIDRSVSGTIITEELGHERRRPVGIASE